MSLASLHLSQSPQKTVMEERGPLTMMGELPARPRVSRQGRIYYERHLRGTGVADLFNLQQNILPSKLKKKRQPKKNFLKQNKDHIWQLQNDNRDKTEIEKAMSIEKPLKIPKHLNNICAKVNNKRPGTSGSMGKKSQSVQNLGATVNENGAASETPNAPRRSSTTADDVKTDFVRLNIKSASNATIKQCPSEAALEAEQRKKEAAFKKYNSGQIPKYLVDRKMEWEQINAMVKDIECPDGHVLMCKEEQQNTKDMLAQKKKDILGKLNSMPVRADTPFLIRKTTELEKQLKEVEEAERIFSKAKVFIRKDA